MNPNYQELLQNYLAINEQIQELTLKQQDLLENLPIKVDNIVRHNSEVCKVSFISHNHH
jgi:hypothetical protein